MTMEARRETKVKLVYYNLEEKYQLEIQQCIHDILAKAKVEKQRRREYENDRAARLRHLTRSLESILKRPAPTLEIKDQITDNNSAEEQENSCSLPVNNKKSSLKSSVLLKDLCRELSQDQVEEEDIIESIEKYSNSIGLENSEEGLRAVLLDTPEGKCTERKTLDEIEADPVVAEAIVYDTFEFVESTAGSDYRAQGANNEETRAAGLGYATGFDIKESNGYRSIHGKQKRKSMDVSYFLEYGVAVGDKNPRIKGANTCFNCGSAYHSIQACPVVKNEDVIRAQARKFRSSATDSSESNKRIHTIVAERKEYLEKLKRHKPGEFSEELRNAMTMDRVSGNFEFVKNMYIHGYPASYISSDKNMNLDSVFDKAMGNETGSEGEVYDDDNDDELVIYTDSGHVLEDVESKKPKRFAKKDVSTTSPSKTQFPTKYYPLAAYPGLNFDDFIFDEPASNGLTLPATKGNLGKPKIITRRTEQAQIWEPVGRLTTQNNFNSSINNVPFTNFANVHLPNSGFNIANARGMPVPGLNSNTAPLYPTTNFTEYQYTYPPSSTLSTTTLPTPNYINPANTGAINQHSGIPGLSSYKYVPANKQTTSNANNHATFKNKTSPKDKSDPVSSALTLDRDDQSVEEGEIVDDENINTDSDMELGD